MKTHFLDEIDSLYSEDDIFILWDQHGKDIVPERPAHPNLFPQTDARYWYDFEYAGFQAKKFPMPLANDGSEKDKRTIAILPSKHPYHKAFGKSMQETAENFGMYVKVLYGEESFESLSRLVDLAISEQPDMIFLNPSVMNESLMLFQRIYKHNIPAIACNMVPVGDAFSYFLSWTGPDAWGETRLLARKMAELMKGKGGYVIVRHHPNCSTYYSRTWSVITELHEAYPDMILLDMDTSYLDETKTEQLILKWIDNYGNYLRGIVSCDDDYVMKGIIRALDKRGRHDIICVSNGSTKVGLDFLRKGEIEALCLKSPIVDGSTPVKIAVDWFRGLKIKPMVFLPKHILTHDDVDDIFLYNYEIKQIGLNTFMQIIRDGQREQLEKVFQNFYKNFSKCRVVSLEYFRGFTIDFLSGLLSIMKDYDLNFEQYIGTYENLFKNLFMQKTMENTLAWLYNLSINIQQKIQMMKNSTSLIDQVLFNIEKNYSKPMSLKTLAEEVGLTPKYLGQEIYRVTGNHFSTFLAKIRIKTSKELLKKTSLSTIEISQRVGFSNPNYFYTVFKKNENCSPSEYRYSCSKEKYCH